MKKIVVSMLFLMGAAHAIASSNVTSTDASASATSVSAQNIYPGYGAWTENSPGRPTSY